MSIISTSLFCVALPSRTNNPALSPQDYSIHDPPLSELGVEQCGALRKQLQSAFTDATANVDHVAVVVSPMRRTMQTAMLSLDWLIDRGVKVEASADWQGG